MKTIFLRHPWFSAGAFAGLLTVCSAAVHPFGTPKQIIGQNASAKALIFSAEVAPVLERSCIDCHSNQTAWPWYSYVAPASWLIERDVSEGRERMNLSQWQQYTFDKKQKLLADIATAVRNGEMPLRPYTLIHQQAKLSDRDRLTVYNWAREERRKLKAALQLASQR